jgi:hypothetical protein
MNVSQIIAKARTDSDAVRLDGTISPLWKDPEMLDLANEVLDMMAPSLRLTRRHYYQKRVLSTDAASTILGRSYNPASLHISAGTRLLTLPPDFAGEVLRITPIVTANDFQSSSIRFKPRDIADPAFVESDMLDVDGSGTGQNTAFFYDLVDTQTLRITPVGANHLDIEVLYVARKPAMYVMDLGTINISGATVTGLAEAGQDFTLVPLPAELIVGTSGTSETPAAPPVVDTNRQYTGVLTIGGASALTTSVSLPAGSYASYKLSSVPPIPDVHHRWMSNMVGDLMLRKISPQLAKERAEMTLAKWRETVLPDLSAPRQSQEPVYTIPYIPDLV